MRDQRPAGPQRACWLGVFLPSLVRRLWCPRKSPAPPGHPLGWTRPRTSSEREIATPPFRLGASRRLYLTSGDDPSRVPYETTEGGISFLSWREVRRGVSVPAGSEGTRSSKPRN